MITAIEIVDDLRQVAPSVDESSESVIKCETSYSYPTLNTTTVKWSWCWTLGTVLLLIGYASEYITERNEILADITAAALSGLPKECMALDATNWLEWIATGPQAQAIERCHRYISIITQVTYPNVLVTAVNLIVKVMVIPITLGVESMSKCLSFFLDQFSYTTGLILVVFTMTFTLVLVLGLCMLCKHTSSVSSSYDRMQYRKWLRFKQQQSSVGYSYIDTDMELGCRNLGIASSSPDGQDVVYRKRLSPHQPASVTAALPTIEEV
jgi:hypothetical protein